MNLDELFKQYDFSGRVVVVTGGAGILGGEIACALVGCNAGVAILDRAQQMSGPLPKSKRPVSAFQGDRHRGGRAQRFMPRLNLSRGRFMVVEGDVLRKDSLELAAQKIMAEWGKIDCLVNAAGGNNPGATTGGENSFFDLPESALRSVSDLCAYGTGVFSQNPRQRHRPGLLPHGTESFSAHG